MLDAVIGQPVQLDNDHALIRTGGFVLRLEISASSATLLRGQAGEVTLYTRLQFNANDGTFDLFGFATPLERECFDIFTGINGIGPRKGLSILSQVEIAPLAHAIVTNDISYLSSLKGVGKKTAERIVVELREKMIPYVAAESPRKAPVKPNVQEAIDAMMALGCKPAVAERTVAEAVASLTDNAKTEDLVKAALRYR